MCQSHDFVRIIIIKHEILSARSTTPSVWSPCTCTSRPATPSQRGNKRCRVPAALYQEQLTANYKQILRNNWCNSIKITFMPSSNIFCYITGCPAKLFTLGYLLFCRLLLMQNAKVGTFFTNLGNLLNFVIRYRNS